MPRPILVQKYGGSSVVDVEHIRRVAARVVATVEQGYRVVVVVSAMGNTTNELLALARSVTPSPGRRELDLLVSVGERVSMTLLAMAIADLGVPAASFTGSQSGIITDEQHVSATVLEVRPHRVERALERGEVAIVAGFQGVSRAGEVTTLGRGGSDTTAVVLAAALGAEHCEICSDVDAVYTADPRKVEDARALEHLPLDAAAALARGGAKVLHAQAVAQAQRLGVQLHAAATGKPPGSGTRLPPGPVPRQPVAVAVDTALRRVRVTDASRLPGFAGHVVSARGDGTSLMLLVDTRNLPDLQPLLEVAGVVDEGPTVVVTVVGRTFVEDPARATQALAALRAAGVAVVEWTAAQEALQVEVGLGQGDAAQRALHAAFC